MGVFGGAQGLADFIQNLDGLFGFIRTVKAHPEFHFLTNDTTGLCEGRYELWISVEWEEKMLLLLKPSTREGLTGKVHLATAQNSASSRIEVKFQKWFQNCGRICTLETLTILGQAIADATDGIVALDKRKQEIVCNRPTAELLKSADEVENGKDTDKR